MFPTLRRPGREYRYAELEPVDRESVVTAPAANYLAFVQLASVRLWLRVNESSP
jgi:hypothetical protein